MIKYLSCLCWKAVLGSPNKASLLFMQIKLWQASCAFPLTGIECAIITLDLPVYDFFFSFYHNNTLRIVLLKYKASNFLPSLYGIDLALQSSLTLPRSRGYRYRSLRPPCPWFLGGYRMIDRSNENMLWLTRNKHFHSTIESCNLRIINIYSFAVAAIGLAFSVW